MPQLVKSVDVVVDQIQSGSYGVAAVEAMAAGRVVVGGIAREVREEVGATIPIVDSNPVEFESTLWEIITNRELYIGLASSGIDFANQLHSGRLSAKVLRQTLFSDGGAGA
ncbi:glycosyltransferase [Dietzia sp. Alg238-R159]|uniref:glycosyltransferase n=1 Tax=Dietzia sp. Alg238-R159 TaxID=2305986 RepID=UPI0013D4A150|nr:glycosyltransferase [Dietzia sp. Alg238-R159]